MRGAIVRFRGANRFLSNFYTCSVDYQGVVYASSEHAFQAAKTVSEEDRDYVGGAPTADEAKRRGRYIKCRDDWEKVKVGIMLDILRAKFRQNPALAHLLKATGEMVLVEGNTWHDDFWGVCYCRRCKGQGKNLLGRALMFVRDELT